MVYKAGDCAVSLKGSSYHVVSCRNQATKILGPNFPDRHQVRVKEQMGFTFERKNCLLSLMVSTR